MSDNLETELEALIDKHGLTLVVSTLGVVCADKAEHLRSNWQDKVSAKVWEADFKTLDKAARAVRSDG